MSPPSARSRSTLVPLLLVAAMMLRALVPAGWMPVATSHGLAMTLCTAAGPVTVKGDPAAPAAPAKQDGSCAFAQIGPAAPAPVPYVAGLPVLFAIVTPEPVKAALRLGEGLGRPPLPATGPPATS